MVENGYPQEGGGRKTSPWLWVLIGCGAVVAVAIVAAIPSLLTTAHRSCETFAIGSCRAYAGAQVMYKKANGSYADQLPKLAVANGRGGGFIDIPLAVAYGPTGFPKQGYLFQECKTIGGKPIDWKKDFALCARPAAYGKTGRRSFIVTTDGIVYGKDNGGVVVDAFPVNLKAAGWIVAE